MNNNHLPLQNYRIGWKVYNGVNYGIVLSINSINNCLTVQRLDNSECCTWNVENVKPVLRTPDEMTVDELKFSGNFLSPIGVTMDRSSQLTAANECLIKGNRHICYLDNIASLFDYLDTIHVDYRYWVLNGLAVKN
jgi:hypothetical protein